MKKFTKIVMSAIAVAAFGCATAAGLTACGQKKTDVVITGSSSVTPLMQDLAAAYEKDHRDVRIKITESSSGAGIQDTQNGLNDFGMSSREVKSTETGVTGVTLCRDGIALVVNTACPLTDVTGEEVKNLFVNGTPVQGVVTAGIGRDEGSGTRTAFDELIGITSAYHASASSLAETGNVIEAIRSNAAANSLGYISFGSVTNAVKTVKLDGVECTKENISSGEYGLQRPFVIVLKDGKTLSDAAQGFYDYIMGEQAQTIIGESYVSVY